MDIQYAETFTHPQNESLKALSIAMVGVVQLAESRYGSAKAVIQAQAFLKRDGNTGRLELLLADDSLHVQLKATERHIEAVRDGLTLFLALYKALEPFRNTDDRQPPVRAKIVEVQQNFAREGKRYEMRDVEMGYPRL